jgi:hypothetical protein
MDVHPFCKSVGGHVGEEGGEGVGTRGGIVGGYYRVIGGQWISTEAWGQSCARSSGGGGNRSK